MRLPETAEGRRLSAFLAAARTGTEAAVREFIGKNFSPAALKETPVEPRLHRIFGLVSRFGPFELERALPPGPDRAGAIVISKKDGKRYELSLELEGGPARGVLGVDFDEAAAEGADDAPKKTDAELVSAVDAWVTSLAAEGAFSGVVLLARDGKPFFALRRAGCRAHPALGAAPRAGPVHGPLIERLAVQRTDRVGPPWSGERTARYNRLLAPAAAMIFRFRDRDALIVSILLPLTTFSILCYEIALTRLFSYIFLYPLTTVAVSLALFGLGSGAYVRVRWLSLLPQGTLAVVAHLASSLSLLALYLVLMLTHNAALVIFASAMPFAFAGVAVSHYYEVRRSNRAAATYALDLSGAAAACIAGVFLLIGVGVDGALLFLAGWTGGAAILASMRAGTALRGKWLLLAALCGVLPMAAYVFRSRWPDPLLNRHSSLDKQLPRLLREQGEVVDTAWSAVGRADVYQNPNEPDIKWILTDATNSTPLVRQSNDADRLEWLQELFAYLPYAIAPVRSALILGSGAGLEVRLARTAAVADIEAVELNPAIIRLVRRWQQFGGPVYDQPGVTLHVEEARKFLLTRQRRYDLIQMSLVLTGTAQTGTFALLERYLYTEEAFRSYLDHLEPTGSLAMIDDSFQRTLKNTVIAMAVFEQTLGLRSDEAMKHVAVIYNQRKWESGYKYLLLVSPAPLSEARIRRLAEEVARRALVSLWLPGVAAHPEFEALARRGAQAFVRGASINLEPPTDDKPFLNNLVKAPADVLRLLQPSVVFSALMFAALVAMFVTARVDRGAAGRRATALAGLYGVGFMFLELGLLHKLTLAVGPTYVLSVLLFALLLYCGLGSLVFGRFAPFLRSRLGSFAIVVGLVGVATSEVIERCYRLEGVSSSVLRVACVLAIVAPIGLCLGAPFPNLLRRYGRSDDRRLAYLWAVNGVGSVLGGALTVILSLIFGGRVVLLAGSVLYLFAWTIDRNTDPSEGEASPSSSRRSRSPTRAPRHRSARPSA